jgi:prolipoprotein diacylglyceryl transferase
MLGSFIVWDPPRAMMPWNIPLLNRPILWYGFFFALGFFLAYFFLVYLLRGYFDQDPSFKKKENPVRAKILAEKTLFYAVIGTLVGARLGDVFFYQDWRFWLNDPMSILRIWEGGLSSHGGSLGVLLAFWLLFQRIKKMYPTLSFLRLMDLVCIPIGVVGGFIRLGNFFNQEILGTCTNVPWAVLFLHPADGSPICPRHPAQLYESLVYFLTSFVVWKLWKQDQGLVKQGRIFGLFLMLVFGFRILIECVKEEQSAWMSFSSWTMGQWLSIPFFLLGLFVLVKSRKQSQPL